MSDRPGHVHDWRFNGRRQDHLAEVICVAEGHDPNYKGRVLSRIVSDRELPIYDGFADV